MKKKLLIITCLFFATISYSQVQLVKDFEPENNNGLFGSNHDFISLNDEIFVPGRGNGATGQELWKSNGTPEGTVILKDINPGIQSSIGSFSSITQDIGSSNLTGNKWNNSIVFNNELYFVAQDGVHGYELWKTDGSTEGTTMVIDITPGIESSEVKNLIVYNNKLYFFAEVYNGSESLYEIDGSNGGVKVIKTLVSGTNNHNNFVTIFKNKMFFSSDGYLWESDGTTNGTVTITRGSPSVQLAPQNILVAGDNMYFTGNSGATLRRELWKSDGTEAGTTVVKIINPNGGFSSVDRFVSFNNEVYFNTNDGVNGFELWKTNGTENGTIMLKDINPGTLRGVYGLKDAVVYNNELYFSATNEEGGKLWKTDGSEQGTIVAVNHKVSDIVVFNNKMFFNGYSNDYGYFFGSTNGTDAGTTIIEQCLSPRNFTVVNNNLFFASVGKLYYYGSETMSLAEYEFSEVSLYPNPTTNKIHIISGNTQVSSVNVYNLTGQKISFKEFSSFGELNLTLDQESGLYLVEIITVSGHSKTYKVIKQ